MNNIIDMNGNIKPINGHNNALLTTFDVMRISTKQKIVGSAGVIGNIIVNDYDLNEMYIKDSVNDTDTLSKLYFMFLWKFKTIHDSKNMWITDMKCGEYKNEAIRWSMEDMERGYKDINGERIYFTRCVIQADTKCKLDVVLFLNGRFIEISELYYIKVNGIANFNTDDFRLGKIVNDLRDDMEELYMEKNYFKALKREFRILTLLDKDKKRRDLLTDLFNGKYGYLYYCISQLNTLKLMKEQTFRNVPVNKFMLVQQTIKDDISKILNYPYSITNLNQEITNIKVIDTMVRYLMEYLNYRIEKYF
jgi:hypothetical protein